MPQNTPLKIGSPKYAAHATIMENQENYEKSPKKRRTRLLKRISLERLMDLKIDYAFKQLFGNEKNKDITVVFLNAILQTTGRKPIKDITFMNTEAGGEYEDDKQSRLDVLVQTVDGELINVEIQFTNQYNMIKRSLFYWARFYGKLEKGVAYEEMPTVIAINIMNFNIFKQTERYHTSYRLYEDREKFDLTDTMEFHFIEMPKLIKAWKRNKLNPWNNVLARWLLMLGMVDRRNERVYDDIYQELEGIAMKDETLKDAFRDWEELSMTQEEYFAYESRLKRIMDEESRKREAEIRVKEAKKEGLEEGIQRGQMKEKEESVSRLLEMGMEPKMIERAMELPLERIMEIKKEKGI